MNETRRHSVDIPLTRTLVALKRVRSLRDPDTSSLNKIAALVDNIVLETSSCNGPIVRSNNRCKQSLAQRIKMDPGQGSLSYCQTLALDASATRLPKHACVHGYCGGNVRRSLDSKLTSPCAGYLEELDLSRIGKFEQLEMIRSSSLKQSVYERSYSSKDVDVIRNAEAQCTCADGACRRVLCRKPVGPASGKGGLRCLCSRAPNFDDRKHLSHVKGRKFQLNSQFDNESVSGETAPSQEKIMSLVDKYMPKMFHELVGQDEVTQCLSDAISRRKIAPIYLFHGPKGTGKTSAARIFAAALNCNSHEDCRPCGSCEDCKLVFRGSSGVVTELDASEASHQEWSKFLSESALASCSPHLKIFIIDECQLIEMSTWPDICKTFEELSKQAVFIMITSELDKLPSATLSLSQRYHFPTLKNDDIISRLQKICMEEELEVEKDVLIFLAKESNGSLRDAIATLDQLALLGKRITSSLAYELMGVISEADLLNLLRSALSSDTPSTVKRARELMGTGIDPMKLTSQLAKVITDILSGGCGSIASKFVAGASKEKLTNALKILVETEKQLRTSKDKSTWLTAALLQFNTGESFSSSNKKDPKASCEVAHSRDDDEYLLRSQKESMESSTFSNNQSSNLEKHYDEAELKYIWRKTIENCQSKSLKNFLSKEGTLASVRVHEGLAVADVVFCDLDHAHKAEEFREIIVASLQSILSRNVDVRISLSVPTRMSRRKPFIFLCCTGGKQKEVYSSTKGTKFHGRRLPLLAGGFSNTLNPQGIRQTFSRPNQKGKSCIMRILHLKPTNSSSSLRRQKK